MKPRYEYFQSKRNRQWYWRLRARNGKTVAQSEGYPSKRNVKRGIEAARYASSASELHSMEAPK